MVAERIVPRSQWLYDDRGMMKWMGWLLSDHSAFMEQAQEAQRPDPVQPQMTREAINDCLQRAWEQSQPVIIQVNVLEQDHYAPAVTGRIVSFDAGKICLQQDNEQMRLVVVSDIRHVVPQKMEKWWLT